VTLPGRPAGKDREQAEADMGLDMPGRKLLRLVDAGEAGGLSRLCFLEELAGLRERAARVNKPKSRRSASIEWKERAKRGQR
jgi:hypothetical protein